MLESAGGLLRAWRRAEGRTQADVAALAGVTDAAVSSWENGTYRIPLEALELLDEEFGADGCLVDLVRAIGTPDGFSGAAGTPQPRRRWGHVFTDGPGPVWLWLRPACGDRLRAWCYTGPTGLRIEARTGPDGVFMMPPFADLLRPVQVVLDQPGWVDFGRGVPPAWLEVPLRPREGLQDLEIINPDEPVIGAFIEAIARRDQGDPATLLDRLGALAEPMRWDQVVTALKGGGEPAVPAYAAPGGTGKAVTLAQVHNYERGRVSRVRYLPALLDRAYGAFGWTCREEAPVEEAGPGLFQVRFPEFWTGPVCVTAEPTAAYPDSGRVSFTWRAWTLDRDLEAGPATAFTFSRVPGDPPLRVRVPAGWAVTAHMGQDPDALDANNGWRPVSEAASDVIFETYLPGFLRQFGITRADLDRALGLPAPRP